MARKKTDEQKAAEAREKRQTQFSTADGALVQAMDGLLAVDSKLDATMTDHVERAMVSLKAARKALSEKRKSEGL